MSGSRCLPGVAIVAALVVVAGCGSTPVSPLPTPTSVSSPSVSPTLPPSPSPSPTSAASVAPSAALLEGQIVFEDAGDNFQHTQIWIENADGSDVRPVVSDNYTDNSASLSPDGSRIVFYRALTDDIEAAVADPSLFGALTIVNIDGSDLHVIGAASGTQLCDASAEGDAWSPDGDRIAYVRYCGDASGKLVENGIWTINADGSHPRQVTRNRPASKVEDHRVGWSPDGKSLVFNRIDTSVSPERDAIFTVGTSGKDLHQVTPWSLGGNDPDWSPDGTEIAFNASAEPSPTQNIWTIHPDGSGLTQLTTYDEDGQATFHPSWSPDGAHILFSHSPSSPDGWGDFFVMDRDGSNQHVIAITALHENHGQWGRSPAP